MIRRDDGRLPPVYEQVEGCAGGEFADCNLRIYLAQTIKPTVNGR
jgi:hypothetical protein